MILMGRFINRKVFYPIMVYTILFFFVMVTFFFKMHPDFSIFFKDGRGNIEVAINRPRINKNGEEKCIGKRK